MKRDDDEDNYHTFTITKPNDLNDPFRFYRDHIEIQILTFSVTETFPNDIELNKH